MSSSKLICDGRSPTERACLGGIHDRSYIWYGVRSKPDVGWLYAQYVAFRVVIGGSWRLKDYLRFAIAWYVSQSSCAGGTSAVSVKKVISDLPIPK